MYIKRLNEFQKAAEQGLPEAQANLAKYYYRGEGVSKDVYKAFEWTRKAAEQGLPEAQLALGLTHYYKGEAVKKKYI